MKIVFLDTKTLGADCDLSIFEKYGEVIKYETTAPSERAARVADAEIIITNKVVIDDETMAATPKLKYIGLAATGFNNVDIAAAKNRGIAVTNVRSYSTEAVAEHTFALYFALAEKIQRFDSYVKTGEYSESGLFTWHGNPFCELSGKTWGIIGLGEIGRRVAEIAKAFGCRVIYFSTTGKNKSTDYERVTFDELLAQADVISVHAPLNDATSKLCDYAAFSKMKKSAYFINVGRGPIVVEKDLARAVDDELIAGAGLDVFEKEPLPPNNPLLQTKNKDRLVLTPHVAWAAVEARKRLILEMDANISAFMKGEKRNRVEA